MVGPLDGAPFDNGADAIVLGLVFPVLGWLVPAFLRDRRAQALLIALAAWKVLSSLLLVQDGWCARVEPSRPYVIDGVPATKTWDVRADWLRANPTCSAIATRPYLEDNELPFWFRNLQPTDENAALPGDYPPDGSTRLTLAGYLVNGEPGVMRVEAGPSVAAELRLGDRAASPDGTSLSAGTHRVVIESTFTDQGARLAPLWNERDLWREVTTTTEPPSRFDLAMRPWGCWVVPALIAGLLLVALVHAHALVSDRWVLGWTLLASFGAAAVAIAVSAARWHFAAVLLLAVVTLPIPERLKNVRGVFVVIGIPWLVLSVVTTALEFGFGRMTFYEFGNDWWQFQQYAHRIFLQGYWLEGGETTFWFQPLYRWIAGALHLAFGDSSVGEDYWDAVGVLIMALFAFRAVDIVAGFRWGLAAAVVTLVTFIAGPGYIFIGRGLSEISAAGFLYLAALCVIEARERSIPLLVAAGAFAVLGVWTRLNNLPMAIGLMAFAWPLAEPVNTLWRPRSWCSRGWRPTLIVLSVAIALGLTLFAARTWYYTGKFSVLFGTQGVARSIWQPGMSFGEAVWAAGGSLMMVLTTTDPPSYHNGAVPVIAGTALSVLALSPVGVLRTLPLPIVFFTLASVSGSLMARGNAYSGRFSIHVIGAAVAVLMITINRVLPRLVHRAHRVRPLP